jgi:hypothetical protein
MPLSDESSRRWRAVMEIAGAEADFTTIVRRSELRAGPDRRV